VHIDDFNLPQSDLEKGIIIETNTTLVNPSIITIDLGEIEFDSAFENSIIGSLSAKKVVVSPGGNHLSLNGFMKAIDKKDLIMMGKVFSFYVGSQDTNLTVIGKRVTPPAGTL
jgi:hypothetical protein